MCVFMVDNLSLDIVLNLPKTILKNVEMYEEYSSLVSKETIDKYYHKGLKKEINQFFNNFRDLQYSSQYSINYYGKHFLDQSISITRKNGSIVEKLATISVDNNIWLADFYNRMMKISSKLTMQEAVYLVDTFFAHRSEEIVSEKLGICRVTLQKIKKSCLVKIWLELQHIEKNT